MTMKKEILMTAAVALMALGTMSCKASDKDSDTGEDTASEMTSQAKGDDKLLAEAALGAHGRGSGVRKRGHDARR